MKKCSIDGCSRFSIAKDLCNIHYQKYRLKAGLAKPRAKNGDGWTTKDGYKMFQIDGRSICEHQLIVENAIGRKLSGTEEIHHANGNKKDNSHGNLVVCPNRAYHKLLHTRTRALEACGNANHMKCRFCKKYDDTSILAKEKNTNRMWHPACAAAASLKRFYEKKERSK